MNDRRVAPILAVVVLAAALPVSGADAVQTLKGKWKADMEAVTRDSAIYKSLPPDEQKKMLEEWKSAPAVVYEFTDKTVVMSPGGDSKPQTFTYTVLKSEGSKLTLKFVAQREDGTEDSDDTDVEVAGPDTLKLTKKGEDGVLTLRRVK
jgi:hypothetical protein